VELGSVQFRCCKQTFSSLLVTCQRQLNTFLHRSSFYPRDALLARVLAMALCPSVCLCLSVTRRCSIETDERIELGFLAWELPSTYPVYIVLKGNSGNSKIKVFPSGTFSSTPDARPLVYHSNHQALSTAQFLRVGQFATADTCVDH